MKNLKLNNSGFTLVEVLVTVGLIATLSLISQAAYKGYKENALRTVAVSNARNIASAYKACDSVGGSCNTFEGIKMGHIQGTTTDEIGTDAICFSLEQASGSQIVRSCVSINLSSGKETYSLGWYASAQSNTPNSNPDKLCYCTDTAGANPILTGSDITCSADANCACPSTGNNQTAKCLAQSGLCQSSGLCI